MANALAVIEVENLQKRIRRIIQVTLSGTYTLSETLDLTGVTGNIGAGKFHRNPDVYNVMTPIVAGFAIELTAGAALTNWILTIYRQDGTTGALAVLNTAAYPAGLSGGKVFIELLEKAA